MKRTRRGVLRSIGAGTAIAVGGVGTVSAAPPRDGETIADIASNDGRFTILVAALDEADLVETLDGNRQLTVFAPTNAAFKTLLSDLGISKEELLNRDDLDEILTYHVAPGRRDAESVTTSDEVPTLNGAKIYVDGTVLNGGQAKIFETNIEASNGYIHAINGDNVDGAGVLLP
ncbi:fasciclin domain-containing protein [Haloarcula sebkhae]|uniref:Fasciclin domain-containing protein n=1 Tax=Haloarcula sebkhae TaxID=932660 RepID=A0ACC6VMT5_9EURY|nr:fasciclin domain-containing protein [Haloarcula sebkhae]